MIKVNELRVGNFIKGISLGSIIKVDLHFFNELYDHENNGDSSMLDWYEGIKLTKEIISKCSPNLLDWFIEGSYILVPDEEYGWCLKVRNAAHFKEIEFGYFKYLHQLQNIYYILSQGVELEWTGSSSS